MEPSELCFKHLLGHDKAKSLLQEAVAKNKIGHAYLFRGPDGVGKKRAALAHTTRETLRQTHPELAIIILTTYKENDLMLQGLQAGARGYLLKDTDRQTLIDTIQAAARGETLLKPEILQQVLSYQQKQPKLESNAENPLSERENEVLQMVAEGARNKEIAYKLGITERTVKAHLSHIFQKLNVDSRAAAVATAAKGGIL